MRLATFNHDRVGIVDGGGIVDITPSAATRDGISAMRTTIRNWGAGAFAPPRHGGPIPMADVVLGPPVPDPTKILAAPVNYRDHQVEMNEAHQVSGLGMFLKAPSSLVGSGGTIVLPYLDRRFDQEAEFAVVIGRRARNVAVDRAIEYVFGYTALLDITMRGGEDRSTRKSFDTFTPMGPWVVTADEFGDPTDVEIECWVDGVLRQRANTGDLIWDVAHLIAYASSVATLEPGDVIATGTPAGVGQIHGGAVVEVGLSGLGGWLRVGVSAVGAVSCPTTGRDSGPVPPSTPTAMGTVSS